FLTGGSHSIEADYSGDVNYSVSSGTKTQTVNTASTTTSLALIPNASTYAQSVIVTATVTSGVSTPTGTVQFIVDGTNFGSPVPLDGNGIPTRRSSDLFLTGGSHSIEADYSGDVNYSVSSGTKTQTVNTASTTTSLA